MATSVQVWGDTQISELLHRYNHSVNYQQQKDVFGLAIIDALGGVFMDGRHRGHQMQLL